MAERGIDLGKIKWPLILLPLGNCEGGPANTPYLVHAFHQMVLMHAFSWGGDERGRRAGKVTPVKLVTPVKSWYLFFLSKIEFIPAVYLDISLRYAQILPFTF